MKKVICIVVVLTMVTFLVPTISSAFNWSGGTLVSMRYYATPSRTLVKVTGTANPDGCTKIDYLYLSEDGSAFAKNTNISIMIALLEGINIDFALQGCSDGGVDGWPVIVNTWFNK